MAIGNPEGVCVGTYAVEILEDTLTREELTAFRKNLVNYTDSCIKTATAISLKMVDAVIGWRIFGYWDSKRIVTVPLQASQILRIGYIPIAVSQFSQNRSNSQKFIEFMVSEEGKSIFQKHNYFLRPQQAYSWIGAKKNIGGEYVLPESWIPR